MALELLWMAAALAGRAPAYMTRLDPCPSSVAPIAMPCTLPERFAPERVAALLRNRKVMWWMNGDRLTLIARLDDDPWGMLCCAIATPLEPIGDTNFAAVTVRVPHLGEALIDVGYSSEGSMTDPDEIRGPAAPPAPVRVRTLRGTIVARSIESAILGERRTIVVYLPPDLPAGGRLPVIYVADGDTRRFAPILEAAIRDGRAAPAMIVGIHPGYGPATGCAADPCDRRQLEYRIDSNPAATAPESVFSRHLRFVTDEVMPLIEREYPASTRREDRITAGYSNGGSWALEAAAVRPDLFRGIIAMSSGSRWIAGHAESLRGARVFGGAGLFESGFLDRTRTAIEAARRAGAEVRMREMVSGHSTAMWEILFADAIAWLLPAQRSTTATPGG